jgi:HEPN domain-containing protein
VIILKFDLDNIMGREEKIRYWVHSAEEDWQTAMDLLPLKRFLHVLFLFHLVIEKLLKAHWVKANTAETPPLTHNLEHLYSQTDLELTAADVDELRTLSAWNIEGRYPDYQNKIHKLANEAYTHQKYETVKRLRQCLLEKL